MIEYIDVMVTTAHALQTVARWDLYRTFAEPIRLRLLGLVAQEELSIGELAQLTGESQPNVSRHVASLRQVGLVIGTKHGTRSMVRLAPTVVGDAVVDDAIANGRALCQADGSEARIAAILTEREVVGREYFARAADVAELPPPIEGASYLAALAHLLPRRDLAIDIGTGDGGLLEVLAPCFQRVIAVDRSAAQLQLARKRVAARGYANVELGVDEVGLEELSAGKLGEKKRARLPLDAADAVFAVRVLHHAAVPRKLMQQLWRLCAPGGALVLIDYEAHADEAMRDRADLWLGFAGKELRRMAEAAGFEAAEVTRIPAPLAGPDAHLPWQVLVARRPQATNPPTKGGAR